MYSRQCLGDGRVDDIDSLKKRPLHGTKLRTRSDRLFSGASRKRRLVRAWDISFVTDSVLWPWRYRSVTLHLALVCRKSAETKYHPSGGRYVEQNATGQSDGNVRARKSEAFLASRYQALLYRSSGQPEKITAVSPAGSGPRRPTRSRACRWGVGQGARAHPDSWATRFRQDDVRWCDCFPAENTYVQTLGRV